ncbi:MAG: zinc-ribbon domain-containing protein [Pseudomonadota bacterium]
MIITCPSCETSYTVAKLAIGESGRQVKCARCKTVWTAEPVDPEAAETAGNSTSGGDDAPSRSQTGMASAAVDTDADTVSNMDSFEDDLFEAPGDGDAAPESVADAVAATTTDPAQDRAQRRARRLARAAGEPDEADESPKRRIVIKRPSRSLKLPQVALAGGVAMAALVLLAVFRTDVARQIPATAGLFNAVGLAVNEMGLTFENLVIEDTAPAGVRVAGEVVNLTARDLPIPPIELALVGNDGDVLFTWNHEPELSALSARNRLPFETRLDSLPQNAQNLRIQFAAR